jgi:hypothetical protein
MGRAWAADRPDEWHTDAYFTEVRQPSQTFDWAGTRAADEGADWLRVDVDHQRGRSASGPPSPLVV